MTDKKIKVLTLSDHPLSPSGVGTQTKYIIEAMLKTGRYQFISMGGAMKHDDLTPQKTEQWGDDWLLFPVDGYGTQDQVRSMLHVHRPDIVWFMTDPRFWGWLWMIEHEIRTQAPMIYYHVWDNKPYPAFNSIYYRSNDYIACISKVTHDIVSHLVPEVKNAYVPHSVDTGVFRKLPPDAVEQFRDQNASTKDRLVFFWNNRNARRKQSGTLIWWFKEFLDRVGHDKACLIMHTDPKDIHGQDLEHIINHLGITNGEVMFSKEKIDPANLAMMYNLADCTINIADAEGFGLATLESLACETPIIVNMTGGLQEQVTDGEEWFGFGLEPTSKAIIGSQDVPYIYEDRVNKEDFVNALVKFYELSSAARAEMGAKGRQHVLDNYNFDAYTRQWDEIFTEVHETCGSWETRKNYVPYSFEEIK